MKTFNSVQAMTEATLAAGQLVKCKRYYESGALVKGLEYEVQATGTADGYIDHTTTNGNVLKLAAVRNMKQAGVTLDGVADDSLALLAYLARCDTDGITAMGAEGTCLLGAAWSEYQCTNKLILLGKGVTFKGLPSTDFLNVGGAFVRVYGCTFETFQNLLTSVKDDVGVCESLTFERNYVTDVYYYCLNIENETKATSITKNVFKDLHTGAIKVGAGGFGTTGADDQDFVENVVITDNICTNIINTGGGNCHFVLGLGKKIVVANNVIDGVSANTGEAWGIYLKGRQSVVNGNTVLNITSTASNAFGINVKGEPVGGTLDVQGFEGTVSGNIVSNTAGGSVGININQSHTLVTGNLVIDYPLGIALSGNEASVSITNNFIRGTSSTTTTVYGIRSSATANNTKIENNTIERAYLGIRFDAAADVSGLSISSNTINDFGLAAIAVIPSGGLTSTVSIKNNNVTDGQKFALVDRCDGVNIEGNTWAGLTADTSQWISLDNGNKNTNVTVQNNSPFTVTTVDAASATIGLFILGDNTSGMVEASVAGVSSTNRALYKKASCVYRETASAIQQGSTADVITPIESNAAWNTTLNTSGTAAQVAVLGALGETVNWSADIKLITRSV